MHNSNSLQSPALRVEPCMLAASPYTEGTGRIHQPVTLPRRIWDNLPPPNQGLSGDVLPGLTSDIVPPTPTPLPPSIGPLGTPCEWKSCFLRMDLFPFGHLFPAKVSLPAQARKSTHSALTLILGQTLPAPSL